MNPFSKTAPFLLFSLFSCQIPQLINKSDVLENAEIQPDKAMELAKPYIDEYGTYNWDESKELKIDLLIKGKWYYISRTNYPAKTINYYLQLAVMVNSKNGKIKFSKRKSK